MAISGEWPCWEIMKCEGTESCPARLDPDTPCWEIAQSLGDYRSAFHICNDCIVFLLKQRNEVLSEREVRTIIERKGVCALA